MTARRRWSSLAAAFLVALMAVLICLSVQTDSRLLRGAIAAILGAIVLPLAVLMSARAYSAWRDGDK